MAASSPVEPGTVVDTPKPRGRPRAEPPLVVSDPVAERPAVPTPAAPVTFTIGGRGGPPLGRPAEAPVASMIAGQPSLARWRVWKDENGQRKFLGNIGGQCQPEDVIAQFPGALPPPGQSVQFVLVGVDLNGKETREQYPFWVSGDSPEVIASRAAALPAPGAPPISTVNDAAIKLQMATLEAALAETRRVGEALAEERKKLAEQAAKDAEERANRQVDWFSREMLTAQQRHDNAMAMERQRADAAKEDAKARAQQDKEERADREKARAAEAADQRDKDKQFQERMAGLQAASSLESVIQKGLAMATAAGFSPAALLAKFTAPAAEGAPALGGAADAIASVVGKLVDQVGALAKTQMELNAVAQGRDQVIVRQVAPARRQIVQRPAHPVPVSTPVVLPRPMPKPAPVAAPSAAPVRPPPPVVRVTTPPKPAPVVVAKIPPPKPAATVTPPAPAKPVDRTGGLSPADLKKTRTALKTLSTKLAKLPESEWETQIVLAVIQIPTIRPYCEAIGIENAAIEAGATKENAARLAAAIHAMEKKK